MAIFEDGFYAVKNGDMYKITLPEPVFKSAKTIRLQLRPETNEDRIRSMTDEELADFLRKVACNTTSVGYYSIEGWLEWLKQESEGE